MSTDGDALAGISWVCRLPFRAFTQHSTWASSPKRIWTASCCSFVIDFLHTNGGIRSRENCSEVNGGGFPWQARFFDFDVWTAKKAGGEAAAHAAQSSETWSGRVARTVPVESSYRFYILGEPG